MARLNTKYSPQTFNDGRVILERRELAEADGFSKPTYEVVKEVTLQYERKTVGVTRYYTALHAGEHIEQVIRIPMIEIGDADTIVLYDRLNPTGKRYEIKQVQIPQNVYPLCMDVSLGGHDESNASRSII